MEHRFLRTEMVLGDRALDRLSRCHVAVFGLGARGNRHRRNNIHTHCRRHRGSVLRAR